MAAATDVQQQEPDLYPADYLDRECAEITFLYRTLFPDRTVRVTAEKTSPGVKFPEPVRSRPTGPPESINTLRTLEINPDATPGEPVQVSLAIPPADGSAFEPSSTLSLRSRISLNLQRLAPLLFEQLKYRVERRWQKRNSTASFTAAPTANARTSGAPCAEHLDPAILIGFHWLETGGAEALAFDCVEWALEAGLRVFVVTDKTGTHKLANRLPVSDRVRFLRSDLYLSRDDRADFFCNLIRDQSIRAVHIHHCNILYHALPVLRADCPDLTVVDSTHIVEYRDGGYPALSASCETFIDLHHVISRDLLETFANRFGVTRNVRLGRMSGKRDIKPASLRMKASRKHYKIAFVGRLVHQKRPALLIEILRRLADWGVQNGVTFEADLVGDGPYAASVDRMIDRHGLSKSVLRHSEHADVPAILGNADLMLLPSSNEGLALVCREAIEQGCIPVCSDVGAQREIVPGALRVPAAPVQTILQMVQVVQSLIGDQALIDQVGCGLHEKLNDLNADPSAREVILEIYQECAAGKT